MYTAKIILVSVENVYHNSNYPIAILFTFGFINYFNDNHHKKENHKSRMVKILLYHNSK